MIDDETVHQLVDRPASSGPVGRCDFCGGVVPVSHLVERESVSTAHGPIVRRACPRCRP